MSQRRSIKRAAQVIKVLEFLSYREYLEAVYLWLKEGIEDYSYLKFADELGFGLTNVIRLAISNRRNLAPASAEKVVHALGLKKQDRRYFLTLVRHAQARTQEQRDELFNDLVAIKQETLPNQDRMKLEYFSEWFYPIIREMTNLPEFRSDPKWVASRIWHHITPKQVETSFKLLERLGLISYEKKQGRHFHSGEQIVVDRSISDMAIVHYHQKMLSLAAESISSVPEEGRDLNTLTICIPREAESRVRDILERACGEIFDLEKSPSDNEKIVIQVNTQAFRILKDGRKRRG